MKTMKSISRYMLEKNIKEGRCEVTQWIGDRYVYLRYFSKRNTVTLYEIK